MVVMNGWEELFVCINVFLEVEFIFLEFSKLLFFLYLLFVLKLLWFILVDFVCFFVSII